MNDIIFERILTVIRLANKLPAGLNDPDAQQKYHRESVEFYQACQNDGPEAQALELADRVYYLIKMLVNDQVELARLLPLVDAAAMELDVDRFTAFDLCIAKYTLRAEPGNPKDDEAERMAVSEILAPF